jgi:hypothetical protein
MREGRSDRSKRLTIRGLYALFPPPHLATSTKTKIGIIRAEQRLSDYQKEKQTLKNANA